MNNRNLNVDAITEMVMRRLVNENHSQENLDEAFWNNQQAQNRQAMRQANRELRKSDNPNAKDLIQQNRQMTRAANSGIRQGTNASDYSVGNNLNTVQSVNAKNTPAPQMLGNVNVNDPNTWPKDAKSAFQFVQQYQNNPTQGAGWLRNVSSLTNNQKFIQHVRSIINNYYAQRRNTQAQNTQVAPVQNTQAAPAQGQMAQNTTQPMQEGRVRLTESQLNNMVAKAVMEVIQRIR